MSRDKIHLNGVVLNLLTGEMIINFKMLGFFMENWVIAEFDATLIVTKDLSRLVVLKFEFF